MLDPNVSEILFRFKNPFEKTIIGSTAFLVDAFIFIKQGSALLSQMRPLFFI